LFLNSLWGKFGQRDNMRKSKICSSIEELNQIIFSPSTTNACINAYSDDDGGAPWVEISYDTTAAPTESPSDFANTAVAAATTSNARIRLHKMLLYLHPSQVCYCDTDSVIFEYDTLNPDHKSPDCEEARAQGIFMGDGLGQWESEVPQGATILKFCSLGPKTYAYQLMKSDGAISEIIKCKGIPLNLSNSQVLTYDTMEDTVCGRNDSIPTEHFTFRKIAGIAGGVQTADLKRTVRSTAGNKRDQDGNFGTLPLGYNKRQRLN
jgi:hypothetical protein